MRKDLQARRGFKSNLGGLQPIVTPAGVAEAQGVQLPVPAWSEDVQPFPQSTSRLSTGGYGPPVPATASVSPGFAASAASGGDRHLSALSPERPHLAALAVERSSSYLLLLQITLACQTSLLVISSLIFAWISQALAGGMLDLFWA